MSETTIIQTSEPEPPEESGNELNAILVQFGEMRESQRMTAETLSTLMQRQEQETANWTAFRSEIQEQMNRLQSLAVTTAETVEEIEEQEEQEEPEEIEITPPEPEPTEPEPEPKKNPHPIQKFLFG